MKKLERDLTEQLRAMAKVATDLNAPLTLAEVARMLAERAREIVGVRTAILRTVGLGDPAIPHTVHAGAPDDTEHADALATSLDASDPEREGWLRAPLTDARGSRLGRLELTGKLEGDFTETDEILLVQLAQMGSLAIANALLVADGHAVTRSRDDLMDVVSHDVRNRLGAIQMGAALVVAKHGELDGVVPRIMRSAKRLEALFSDLADATRIGSNRFTVQPVPCRLAPIAREAAEAFNLPASDKGLSLVVQIPPALPEILADRTRIHQVLANLIGNAVKFSAKGGQITVDAVGDTEGVRVSVIDTGDGVAPDRLAQLFDRQWEGRKTSREGVGLGLFIAKGIVAAHGGRIWAESDGRSGTTLSFTLSVAEA